VSPTRLHSGKRPDVTILGTLRNIITGVRTVVGADPRYCADAAGFPGHGALWGAMRKNGAWLEHAITQGDAFYALCHEAGGHMGDSAYDFLGMIIDSREGRQATAWPSRSTPSSGAFSELPRGRGRHQLAAGDSHGAWCPLACSPWGPPALSRPSTLEAPGASRARPYHNHK